ncbi:alkaline phosphatase family protein [Paractinoplanes ferrugineus]|uniref:Alkaline phosphatase family protein n=1 Tax=Paractinoplanes ferrugineus TaxID=113564 RepID=A0A919J4I9_9ACTN|nr:nucleotide pyrophosphatase/phosphodiesterase family protein [Actinoplanes ferrugineus]GIE14350.1 alkaline phosphatase family protein [Actinoplanes ferrugineus]
MTAAAGLGTVRPAYGSGSLAELMPSVAAVLGVPGTTDSLALGLDDVDRVAVLLVDGLGAAQVPVAATWAPILNDLGTRTLTAGFPSTTPVSLVTVGTGAPPGAHGVLGFTVRQPGGAILNHIQWAGEPDPFGWQPVPTIFERSVAAGVPVTVVNRPEYDGSGLSVAAYRGARYAGAADAAELAAGMLAALSAGPGIVYGYHPELDKAGHVAGVDSEPWRAAAAELDVLLDRLVHGLPPRSALLVVADHGQLNIPLEGRLDLADRPELSAGVTAVAGEPRVRYLYAEPGAQADVIAAWKGVYGDSAYVLGRAEAVAEGWFGPVPAGHLDRIGEIVVVCRDHALALATGWEPEIVGRLVGYHGALTAVEMTVPLLIAR